MSKPRPQDQNRRAPQGSSFDGRPRIAGASSAVGVRRSASSRYRRSPTLERLESRSLLATWIAQGPGPLIDGQAENVPVDNPVIGAIKTIAADPIDANV